MILRNASNGGTTPRKIDVGSLADFERLKVEGNEILKSPTKGCVIRSISITEDPADEGNKIIVETCVRDKVLG